MRNQYILWSSCVSKTYIEAEIQGVKAFLNMLLKYWVQADLSSSRTLPARPTADVEATPQHPHYR